jgi:hypothetical protein
LTIVAIICVHLQQRKKEANRSEEDLIRFQVRRFDHRPIFCSKYRAERLINSRFVFPFRNNLAPETQITILFKSTLARLYNYE